MPTHYKGMTKKEFADYQRTKFIERTGIDLNAPRPPKPKKVYKKDAPQPVSRHTKLKLTDPEKYQKLKAKWKLANERRRERYRTDPVYRERQQFLKREQWRKQRDKNAARRAQRYANPAARLLANEKKRNWIEKNRERHNATHRAYYERNREKYLADEIKRRDRRNPVRKLRRAIAELKAGELGHSEFVETFGRALVQVNESISERVGHRERQRGRREDSNAQDRHGDQSGERDHSDSPIECELAQGYKP